MLRRLVLVTFIVILVASPLFSEKGGTDPFICIEPSLVNFGYNEGGNNPPSQNFRINNRGPGSMPWTVSTDAPWLSLSPGSGTNAGTVTVTCNPQGLMTGTHHATITVTAPNASNSPRTVSVTLKVIPPGGGMNPIGHVETPADGASVSGSIAVTGWALDDTGVESVKVYNNTNMGEVFLGDANFVEGQNYDIIGSYPQYPNVYQAGWGYMLLTNFLPGGGNGTYQITTYATDLDGNKSFLGSRTIHADNENAVKPFGAIDSPAPGETVSGSTYRNWGWALTPQPNTIPTDGSFISVQVDGQHVGSPNYGIYRQDIAALFPDYNNSQGAVGYFDLDVTQYANGVHTISWSVSDDAGNTDGIGSRYFTIQTENGASVRATPEEIKKATSWMNPQTQTGTFTVSNPGTGTLDWTVTDDSDWLICTPQSGSNAANTGTDVTVTIDPTGLSEGNHQATVTVSADDSYNSPQTVTVDLNVVSPAQDHPPFGTFDTPLDGSTVRSSIPVTGWALDDVEVDNVKIYNGNQFVGDAVFVEGARPDVAALYPEYPNNTNAGWGYMLLTNFLPNGGNGTYTLHAIATDATGKSVTLGTKTITCDNANAVKPFGAIDDPWGRSISGNSHRFTGWALTPLPNKIPEDGSTINVFVDGQNVGHATYNRYRPDIAHMFPEHANSNGAGFYFDFDATQYADGVHTIYWTATDDAGNTDGIGSRYFTIVKEAGDGTPSINVDRSKVNVGVRSGSTASQSETFTVSNQGSGTLQWNATDDSDWLVVTPGSGSGLSRPTITIEPTGLTTGQHHGTVTVSSDNADNSPQTVQVVVTVYDDGTTMNPFGSFDSPLDNTSVSGSVVFTGWALDDVGVDGVGLWNGDLMGGQFIGDAVFVEGARPDIEATYPKFPGNNRAAWELTYNTNLLPGGGNGTYIIDAIAIDKEGNRTTLGSKTIIVDNANAVKPFGAIDTPLQGGTVSGDSYINWGWALTPQPKSIPTDGSTITVYVDGVPVGNPNYNVYRQDHADLFPDLVNSQGSAGYFDLDLTGYADGVHTIQWVVTDDAGANANLGPVSFFLDRDVDRGILNVDRNNLEFGADQIGNVTPAQDIRISNSGGGPLDWSIKSDDDWLIIDPQSGSGSATVSIGVNPTGLNEGNHRGTVTISSPNSYNGTAQVDVGVLVTGESTPPFGSFDTPGHGTGVSASIPVTGWALDDIGVDGVQIQYSQDGTNFNYIGDASLVEGARPDVEQTYPTYPQNYKAGWGYMLLTNFLPNGGNGTFHIRAIATDTEGNQATLGTKTVHGDNAHAVKPFGAIDAPWGQRVSGSTHQFTGWALAPKPNTISNIEVHINGQSVGNATYGHYRADIAQLFPDFENADGAGAFFTFDATGYNDGVYTIEWTATDNAGNMDGIGSRYFVINMDDDDSDPEVSTNRKKIASGSVEGGSKPPTQSIPVGNSGGGELDWSATGDSDWLNVTPGSGSDPGLITVEIDNTGIAAGTYNGLITITDDNASNSPVVIPIEHNVYAQSSTDPPFGELSNPLNGANVQGTIPVNGAALDDVGVAKVSVYIDGLMGVTHRGNANILIESVRPDYALNFPDFPNNTKAGFEFTLNTYALEGGGNGTYGIIVKATDVEGKTALLDSRVIHCDNANAVKPFGAIDTPIQGGTASGSSYINWGWALTPQPKHIPTDGSTIEVFIDNVNVGTATTNIYRQDIADLFPEFSNARGAGVRYEIDTYEYEDGDHTLFWRVTDDAGVTHDFGHRKFKIFNSEKPNLFVNRKKLNFGADTQGRVTPSQIIQVKNTGSGTLNWDAMATESWIKLNPSSGSNSGAIVVTIDASALSPGVHRGTIRISDPNAYNSPQYVDVVVTVHDASSPPIGGLNNPATGGTYSGGVVVSGWGLDEIAVKNVGVYYEGSEIYLGDATFVEGARPDIADLYPNYPRNGMAGWSYTLLTNLLPDGGNGEYKIYAKATDFEGNEVLLGETTITADNINAVDPFGDIDTPEPGGTASGTEFVIEGWTLTPPPNTIPEDGSTIEVYIDGVKVGYATYNIYRDDIATQLPGYNNSQGAGATFTFDTTPYENGVHTLSWTVRDDAANKSDDIGNRQFIIQNPPIDKTSVDDGEAIVPTKMALHPAFPNPFNPETKIIYDVAEPARVNLIVYDILGKEILRLVDGVYQNAGRYRMTWYAQNEEGEAMPTGVYLVVMQAGQFVKTQKLILLR